MTKKKVDKIHHGLAECGVTYMHIAATTTRPDRPFSPVSICTSLLRFLPLTILCSYLFNLLFLNISKEIGKKDRERHRLLKLPELIKTVGSNKEKNMIKKEYLVVDVILVVV